MFFFCKPNEFSKPINFAAQEHRSDWFLKVNPRHTVPVLVDQGVSLCDSHAIITYMVNQYGQSQHEHLYPKDFLQRAIIDERLYYENGILFQVIKDFVARIMYGGEISYHRKSIELSHNAYTFLEEFLARNTYVAGEHLTLADISINTTLITLHKLVTVEERRYPKICAWMQRLREELPEYEELNEKGAQQLYLRFQNSLEDNMTKHA
ncbi:PREDICTED: glutathione S-transferase 1-like [Rhagoletis zephyria]|uniref:glutathione S-transferase 1-like n=1 Tax=Rhagoletis zephyria TaxID=28612 RepID=UPI00081154EC|nr:PREDICTED: glutathione S-transferase 1-like [Rhagoletis zephyria]